MRMRLDATTRSPASSSILVTAPVRLRRVASGLMIEKVRVTAMTGRSPLIGWSGIGRAPSRARARRQGLGFFDPLATFVCPIAPLDAFPPGKQFPGEPGAFERAAVKQIKASVVGQRRRAPQTVGNQHIARLVGRVGACRQKDGLARIITTSGDAEQEQTGR